MATNQVRVVVNSLEDFIDQVIKSIVLDITANLKNAPSEGGTPVDTGWARANWVPQIGTPFSGTAGSRPRAGTRTANDSASTAGIASVVTQYTASKGPAHVTNNVPYITRLNQGYSRQAPAGFVQIAVIKAVINDLPKRLGATPTPRGRQPRDPLTGRSIPRRG